MKRMEGVAVLERPGDAASRAERRAAFERLTEPRLGRAYRLATIILGDPGEGEDAVHDAAVRAWTRWHELQDPQRFEAWFDSILINTCRDRLRQRRVRPLTVELTAGGRLEPSTEDGFDLSAERDALHRGLAALGPEHRLVVVLHYLEDLPIAEIATRTGQREGTVKSRLHYALRELRAAYDAAARRAPASMTLVERTGDRR